MNSSLLFVALASLILAVIEHLRKYQDLKRCRRFMVKIKTRVAQAFKRVPAIRHRKEIADRLDGIAIHCELHSEAISLLSLRINTLRHVLLVLREEGMISDEKQLLLDMLFDKAFSRSQNDQHVSPSQAYNQKQNDATEALSRLNEGSSTNEDLISISKIEVDRTWMIPSEVFQFFDFLKTMDHVKRSRVWKKKLKSGAVLALTACNYNLRFTLSLNNVIQEHDIPVSKVMNRLKSYAEAAGGWDQV